MRAIISIGNGTAGASPVLINLSESISNYHYLCIRAEADGQQDFKFFPVGALTTQQNISGRGVYLKIMANDAWYWEGNIGFYSNGTQAEVLTLHQSGWYPGIDIFGIR